MKTLATTAEQRKSRFKAALNLTGRTMWAFAADHGMSASRLTRVLNGEAADDALLAAIDAFANETLAKAANESAA